MYLTPIDQAEKHVVPVPGIVSATARISWARLRMVCCRPVSVIPICSTRRVQLALGVGKAVVQTAALGLEKVGVPEFLILSLA